MATRQRARSTRKAPAVPAPIPADQINENTVADVPGIEQTAVEQTAQPHATPHATFVGEQIVYKNREERIAETAYLYAESRGFAAGYAVEDWLKAEREIDAMLSGSGVAAD